MQALQELNNNKLRSLLSLTGITIGIFCIISVFAAVDSLEGDIRGSLSDLGDDVVYVQKWPWAFGGDYPWWKYINRPEPNVDDYKAIARYSEKAEASAIQVIMSNKTVQYRNNHRDDVMVSGGSYEFGRIYAINFSNGRYFTQREADAGSPVAIIGNDVALALFPYPEMAVGKTIKAMGQQVRVVGVIEKEGQGLISTGLDDAVMVPYDFLARLVQTKSRVLDQRVVVLAKDGVPIAELKDELTRILRNARRLRPKEEDNFALNQMSVITEGITQMFGVVNLAGGFIGIFSILVGGFGIANIMFVSVRERTRFIGIKLSIGAKRSFILTEFLIESIILCIIGGLVGLLLVQGLFTFFNQIIDFTLVLSLGNIILGIGMASGIGIISGFFPAFFASRLDPVEAIRK